MIQVLGIQNKSLKRFERGKRIMKRNTLLMILILCIGITVISIGAFATDPAFVTGAAHNTSATPIYKLTESVYVGHTGSWFKIVPTQTERYYFTLTGTDDVVNLAVYNALFTQNSSLSGGAVGDKTVSISCTAGNTYYIQVSMTSVSTPGPKTLTISDGTIQGVILSADTTSNDVTSDLDITFESDGNYESAVSSVSFDGTLLENDIDYTVSSGKITLKPGGGKVCLRTVGTGTVLVTATGYENSSVSQTINPGPAHSLEITQAVTAPASNGGFFVQQPKVTLKDIYGNICINDNATVITASRLDGGSWTLTGTTTATANSGVVTFVNLGATNGAVVEGAQLGFDTGGLSQVVSSSITLLAPAPTYTITAIINQTLTSVTEGYGSGTQETKNLTITRTGTGELTNLATSISGGNFTITQPVVTTLNGGTPSTTFTVKANDGLSAGTYTETVTISADNMTSETFTVTQVVSAVTPPSAPTEVIATAGDTQASIVFNPPTSNGGSAITEYTVTSSPGGFTGTGASSPITVTGLTNGITYTFIVTATNSAGTGSASLASNSVTPNADPLITSVVVPANGTYTTGQNLDFTVNFSENVNVTGSPYLTINIGGSDVNAEYISGSGISSLVFRYTISNENDADGITISSPIVHNSGTITGLTSGRALTNWALANVGSTTGILVDTQAVQATPIFNPGAGVIASGSTVLITSPGADSIFYTTDGTAPTTESTNQATTPLVINGPVTVKAIAVKAGMTNSEIGTAIYTQTVLPSTYTMMEISNQTLTSVTAGYGSGTQETKNLTITRTGTGDLVNLATSISGGNFTITQPVVTTLNDGTPSTSFTVKANDGLAAGTYTETVTVSATNMTSETITVTQVVNAISGGGGGGSDDDSSPSPEPAPVATILNEITTLDDQKLETSLQLSGEAKIDLNSTGTGQVSISGDIINQLSQLQKPLDIAGQGVSLLFGPNALQNPQTNAGNNLGTVEIGAVPVGNQEKEELLAATPLGQSTGVFQVGGQIFNFTAQRNTTTDGSTSRENIGNFAEPVAVTIDLSGLNLTSEQISQLTGTRLEKNEMGEIVPVFLGGNYDLDKKTFTFFTEKFSLYTVLQKKDLVILNLSIDNTITKINGEIKNIDVPPSLMNNRTFVPLRYIGEALGASFDWDNESRTVTFQCADQTLDLVVGQNITGMDIGPVIINGRTMVPLRYISENFGAQVMWFPNSRSVSVVK